MTMFYALTIKFYHWIYFCRAYNSQNKYDFFFFDKLYEQSSYLLWFFWNVSYYLCIHIGEN